MSRDWNVGDRVYDLKLHRLTGRYVKGTVTGEESDRMGVYVEWDCDPGTIDFMYDDELADWID